MQVVNTTNSWFPPLQPNFPLTRQSVLWLFVSTAWVTAGVILPTVVPTSLASASPSQAGGDTPSSADFSEEAWPEISRDFNAVPIQPFTAEPETSSVTDDSSVPESTTLTTPPATGERMPMAPSLKERLAPRLPRPHGEVAPSGQDHAIDGASARYLDAFRSGPSTVDDALNSSQWPGDAELMTPGEAEPEGPLRQLGESLIPSVSPGDSKVQLNPNLIFNPLEAPALDLESSGVPSAYISPSQPWLSASYTLTVGDRLSIIFQNVPEYTAQYQVQLDGSLQLPVIGRFPVWGLTLGEVEEAIEQVYAKADILRHPNVSLGLLAMAPPRIAISGEVSKPGSYRLALLDTNVMPTITDALQQAGGITQRTNLQRVHIDRRLPSGELQRLTVNLWELLKSGDLTQNVALRDGDSLTLEVAPPLDNAQAIALGNANVAQGSITVGIWGETQQAGTFEIPPNTPLNQVLLAAGGFNERAQRKTVDLIRLNPNGNVTQQTITVDLTASVSETHNPIIQDRDIIMVEASRLFRFSDGLNRVVTPFTNTINQVLQPVSSIFSVMNVFELFRGFFGNAAP